MKASKIFFLCLWIESRLLYPIFSLFFFSFSSRWDGRCIIRSSLRCPLCAPPSCCPFLYFLPKMIRACQPSFIPLFLFPQLTKISLGFALRNQPRFPGPFVSPILRLCVPRLFFLHVQSSPFCLFFRAKGPPGHHIPFRPFFCASPTTLALTFTLDRSFVPPTFSLRLHVRAPVFPPFFLMI